MKLEEEVYGSKINYTDFNSSIKSLYNSQSNFTDNHLIIQLLDSSLKQQELRLQSKMDGHFNLSISKKHKRKHRDSDSSVQITETPYKYIDKKSKLDDTTLSETDKEERRRRKLLKKQRKAAHEEEFGQSITNFINTKIQDFEKQSQETAIKKKKKIKHHNHDNSSNNDVSSLTLDNNVENETFHIHKRKKHKLENDSIIVKDESNIFIEPKSKKSKKSEYEDSSIINYSSYLSGDDSHSIYDTEILSPTKKDQNLNDSTIDNDNEDLSIHSSTSQSAITSHKKSKKYTKNNQTSDFSETDADVNETHRHSKKKGHKIKDYIKCEVNNDQEEVSLLSHSNNVSVDSERSVIISTIGIDTLSDTNVKNDSQDLQNTDDDLQCDILSSKQSNNIPSNKGSKVADNIKNTTELTADLYSMLEVYVSNHNADNDKSEDEKISFSGKYSSNDEDSSNETRVQMKSSNAMRNKKEIVIKSKNKKSNSSSKLNTTDTLNQTPIPIDIDGLDPCDIEAVQDALDASLTNKDLLVTAEDIWALENLYITIPWAVPVSHTIESRMSSVPTKEQQEKLKTCGIKIKTGPYTSIEDDTIRANWAEFCELHNLKPNPQAFINFKIAKKAILSILERIKFVQYLGRGLENRMLYSIHKRFRKLFFSINKGKYSQNEDEIIMTYTKHSQSMQRFSQLATLFNRDRNSVIKRYLTLTSQQDQKWSMALFRQVIEHLITVTGVNTVHGLKTAEIPYSAWEDIVAIRRLKTTPIKIQRKWNNYIYPRLFQVDNELPKIRKKLIKIFSKDEGTTELTDVNWDCLSECFDDSTGEQLKKIYLDMLHAHVPEDLQSDFKASVNYLKHECSDIYKPGTKFVYEDGQLYAR